MGAERQALAAGETQPGVATSTGCSAAAQMKMVCNGLPPCIPLVKQGITLVGSSQTNNLFPNKLSREQVDNALALDNKLSAAGRALVPLTAGNLVDAVWGAERPPPPAAPLRTHALEHAGEAAGDKIRRMRQEMAGARPTARPSGSSGHPRGPRGR